MVASCKERLDKERPDPAARRANRPPLLDRIRAYRKVWAIWKN